MPEISQQDIDNIVAILQRDEVPVTQFGVEDPDPLVIEGKMDYVLDAIKGIPQGPQGPKGDTGSQGPEGPQGPKGDNGEVSQAQLDEVISAVGANVDGIARVEQQKQDKLAQVDLDNIASINQMKDDINAKQNKLSDTQLQAIGEIDAIKAIALDNQANKASKAEVTELAQQVNTNATKLSGLTLTRTDPNIALYLDNYSWFLFTCDGARQVVFHDEISKNSKVGLNVLTRYAGDGNVIFNGEKIPCLQSQKIIWYGYDALLKIEYRGV